jgi:hypothetical protein
MKCRLVTCALLILASISSLPAPIAAQNLPIMTWLGPGKDLLTPEMFKKIAAAGFTVNMSFLGDRALNLKALDLARAAGISLMVHDDRIAKLIEDATLPLDPLDHVVADYKDHPAFFGYYILDEPNASKFARLGQIVQALKARDPKHPAYINLFPTYANAQQLGTDTYEKHVSAYLATVKPAFLSYDHYPVTDKGLRPDYYRNLEIVRAQAAAQGIPFWAFTLSVAHAVYPVPTEAHIRLQLFSDVAYGAKGLQYFTFATPEGTDYDWKPALIDARGAETPRYEMAKTVNREVLNIASLILRWTSVAVFHSEPLPEETRPIPPDGLVRAVRNASTIVGLFKDGPDDLVMIVNKDFANERLAVVDFAPEVRGLREIAKSATAPVRLAWERDAPSRTAALTLGPGDARIFRLVR